jgi:hypothetical protein
VVVDVIELYCTQAPACAQTKAQWGRFFAAAGAARWSFADPQQTDASPPLLGGSWPPAVSAASATSATSVASGGGAQ